MKNWRLAQPQKFWRTTLILNQSLVQSLENIPYLKEQNWTRYLLFLPKQQNNRQPSSICYQSFGILLNFRNNRLYRNLVPFLNCQILPSLDWKRKATCENKDFRMIFRKISLTYCWQLLYDFLFVIFLYVDISSSFLYLPNIQLSRFCAKYQISEKAGQHFLLPNLLNILLL